EPEREPAQAREDPGASAALEGRERAAHRGRDEEDEGRVGEEPAAVRDRLRSAREDAHRERSVPPGEPEPAEEEREDERRDREERGREPHRSLLRHLLGGEGEDRA